MIGETLGQRYKLLRLLGKGGMGSVYEAEQQDTCARVAVKVLHGHLLDPDGDGPHRFRREAEAASAIGGDHVARVLDAGRCEATGALYLVTEHLDGEDLQRRLDRVGPLVPEAALRIAFQALLGLAAAHEARVVHRDIKPANLFLARGERGAILVKILDFGIAKVRAGFPGLSQSIRLTVTGGFLGSPLYASPEQVQSSHDVDARTDLWSLGCVLYAVLAGRAPFEHLASIGQVLVAICVSAPPSLAEIAPWVPPEIAEVVHRALALRPDDRFQSAAAMLDALRRLVPSGALDEDMLTPSGERALPVIASPSSPRPLLSPPRVVVAPNVAPGSDRPIRGDERTAYLFPARPRDGDPAFAMLPSDATLPSSATLASGPAGAELRSPARSGVPAVGARAGGRHVTVDPRRLLGERSELWTFSLEVHRHVPSLIGRVWKALRRAGADLRPMSYGTAWVLIEPRTGRTITEVGEDLAPLSLTDAGIRPGIMLWVVAPEEMVMKAGS